MRSSQVQNYFFQNETNLFHKYWLHLFEGRVENTLETAGRVDVCDILSQLNYLPLFTVYN